MGKRRHDKTIEITELDRLELDHAQSTYTIIKSC